jgi:hypothetical protein
MMEFLLIAIVVPAMVVGSFAVLFGLSRVVSLDGINRLASNVRSWRFNLWHMMAVMVVAALLLSAFSGPPSEGRAFSIVLLALGVLAWFIRVWCDEFVFLMGLRDDDFPGRNDKLIWATLLLLFAPISAWLFRSYHVAHWPEPKPAIHPGLDPEPTGGRTATQPV